MTLSSQSRHFLQRARPLTRRIVSTRSEAAVVGDTSILVSNVNQILQQQEPMNMSVVGKRQWKRLPPSKVLCQSYHRPLPKTLTEVLKDSRPCMITTLNDPTTIVNVNDRFVKFTGYLREESLNQKVSSLLHGPETDTRAAKAIVEEIAASPRAAEGILIHYTKSGRAFTDHMRIGKIRVADGSMEYLVGVMQEVNA